LKSEPSLSFSKLKTSFHTEIDFANMPSLPVFSAPSPASAPQCLPQVLQTPSGLALMELQGTIHIPPVGDGNDDSKAASGDKGKSSLVGKLLFPGYLPSLPKDDTAWMKPVYLYVGKHQRLTGEVKKLPKPIGILRKRQKQNEDDLGAVEFVEIVKYKVIFSQRPEPVSED
jgi:hypothetical protein